MNSTSFTKTIGIKLVKTVRKYPCLWDYSSRQYDEKESNVAWKAVANEMSSSVSKCYKRWVGIKYRYIRQGREKNRKKANYLAKHLGFLAPQVSIINMNQSDDEEYTAMSIESKATDKESNKSSEDEDVDVEATNMSPPFSRINENLYESVVGDMERTEPKKSMHELNITIPKDNKPFTEQVINLKRERNDTADDDDSGIFVQCSIRKKDRTAPVVDGKQSFLNSLFPYLQEMTGKQNRRFRHKVIAVIDEILDDAVIL